MEKIHINDYIKEYKEKFRVLVDKYDFHIKELTESSIKSHNSKIHKIQYINESVNRLIEVVLASEDYGTHMFSRYCDTYFKRISSHKIVPDYTDIDNCFNLFDISELAPNFNSNTEIDLILKSIDQILTGKLWPSNELISGIKSKRLGYESKAGYRNPPYILEIKSALSDLTSNKFEIVFDESSIPPYEQSFMGPTLTYKNTDNGTIYSICFQTRDQEFYVAKNSNSNWFYGIATKDKYEELRNKIIKN